MVLEGKDCKNFITKLVKLANTMNKYNIESILLIQFCILENTIEPILINKPISQDYFEYLETAFDDNPIYSRIIKYGIDKSKIKIKKNNTQYTPIVIATNNAFEMVKIKPESVFSIEKELSSNFGYFTETYFFIPDLFKDFISIETINSISIDERGFQAFDSDKYKYDTSSFMIPNKISDFRMNNKSISENSPKIIFPSSEDDKNNYFSNEIKYLFNKLNLNLINIETKSIFPLEGDVGKVSEGDIGIDIFLKNIKSEGVFWLKNASETLKMLTFDEFFKTKFKYFLFCKKETILKVDDSVNSIPIVYAGLILRNKDNIIYLFYKYFKYDRNGEK